MKKSILTMYMLMLVSFLSCDVDAISALINEAGDKFVEKKEDGKNLDFIEKIQECRKEQADVVEQHLKERKKQVLQAGFVEPVNVDDRAVILNSPYYSQEEIEIKKEELVPSTDEEKAAQKEIDQIKNLLGNSEFGKLTEEQLNDLRIEYEKLNSSFYDIFSELQNRRESYSRNNRDRNNNKVKSRKLIQLHNKLNDQRSNLEKLMNQVDSGFNKLVSAKYFLKRSQETLKEAITERVKNNKKRRNYWSGRKVDSNSLARQALNEAENALNQLESYSINLIEVMGEKKEIEELIKEAKTALENLER
ncbi:P12 family lipoprotein (plasmid) [Borrelia miyamotoi]|nr:P12 family lipoprotein [Borrelia miyamotoi]WAZ72260.1 P12 family lipoprotein [Borrelia miyamotoi]WAZ72501.1 P12 family lipoprotein [Borrelia miyamotoi]WVI05252.1 P12 family lipoprotein [Borrelia miyamotoi]WVI05425.1 P12 family lipoprotein [Borrelia miyamotoi]